MQFIKPGINIDFIGKRKIAFFFSVAMILASIGTLVGHKGPRYGIDFAGGTLVQVKFESPVTIDRIKSGLENMKLAASAVQQFGQAEDNEYLIRTDATISAMDDLSETIERQLKAATGVTVEIRRVEMVGPQVGQDLREKALFAMFYALLFITVYISGRFELKWAKSAIVAGAIMGVVYLLSLFNVSVPFLMLAALIASLVVFWFFEFKYAMGAIVALIHDVTITVGIFSIFDKEFTLPIVAALLTIIGYSLNDTIIVFDRIRENLRKYHKEPMTTIVNKSINETLSRTILTSLTTLVVVVALFVLGGGIIHDFSFALLVGILVGTYSSVYVASPILLAWQSRRK
ncbi:protein-export membrane protein SecF [Desulfosarcina alkanivorans]|uniref:Protein-export membrane protein SecF n=1 Tax=Desulfosarcina alkanivorans TaxID=571177 RepID=A0A5K7YDS9_9BACT|nr:protein translocase subunit SecF [Desulfosarcina alkanivorans]BBO66140.1 protein-export membrane protein SecF [Desulfosarcina alkanivorans]